MNTRIKTILLFMIAANLTACAVFKAPTSDNSAKTSESQTATSSADASGTDAAGKPFFPVIKPSGTIKPVEANIRVLRTVTTGMHKDQVYALIGRQHNLESFNHLIGNEWDYLFNFRKPGSKAFQTCQYKVLFDDSNNAKSIHWNPASCANWLNYADESPAKEVVTQVTEKINYVFSADGFFAFDKSGITDLQPGGIEKLNRILADIKNYGDLVNLKVTGHTDRLGSLEHNNKLSNARALTIKRYLVNAGVSADLIETNGVADAQPIISCPQKLRDDALISCLGPNRRFEVEAMVTKAGKK